VVGYEANIVHFVSISHWYIAPIGNQINHLEITINKNCIQVAQNNTFNSSNSPHDVQKYAHQPRRSNQDRDPPRGRAESGTRTCSTLDRSLRCRCIPQAHPKHACRMIYGCNNDVSSCCRTKKEI
jgi:hypothetical protein